jgi:RNA polymerase sigma-70 factor, ECF subfamily
VYRELHLLAERWMRRESNGHTLQATALVHEAYLRIAKWEGSYSDKRHFYAIAIRAIRQVLVNHAASRRALRRGGDRSRVPLHDDLVLIDEPGLDLIALDDLLRQLEGLNERQARVVELRFFGGLSVDEAAEVLGCSSRTVDGDWQMARSWLLERLSSIEG